jgi:hypothetical protein
VSDDRSLLARLSRAGSVDRLDLFAEWWDSGEEVPVAEFYEVVRLVWSSAELPYRYDDVWPDLWEQMAAAFEGDPKRRAMLMTADELETHAALPDEVMIYRGFGEWKSEHSHPSAMWEGYSWTLDRDRALWFAKRFALLHGKARLATAIVPRTCIIALLDERGEHEVIVVPEQIAGHVDIERLEVEHAP